MNITIPRITRTVALSDFAPEFGEAVVYVWVNPPRDFLARYFSLLAEIKAAGEATKGKSKKAAGANRDRIGNDIILFFSELWSQNPDPETHWPREHIIDLINNETAPGLYVWLTSKSIKEITAFQSASKKNRSQPVLYGANGQDPRPAIGRHYHSPTNQRLLWHVAWLVGQIWRTLLPATALITPARKR